MADKDKAKKQDKKETKAEKKDSEREKNLKDTLDVVKTKFGKDAIMRLGEVRKVDVEAVPTGSISLDIALGIGGIPRGRIIEVYGPESSGKTTLALHVLANFQKRGGTAAFVDAEHALDPIYAEKLGVKTKELLVSQPETGEQALDIVETLVRSGNIDVIVVDSVAALTPKAEIEGEMGQAQMGSQARLMSHALRKLTGIVSQAGTTIIFINQTRMKIGVMFGNPETTAGGTALKFYCSVRIEVRRIATIKQGDKMLGNRTRAKVVKNKVAAPFQQAEFDIMWSKGISKEGDILDKGVEKKIVSKSGSWYNYGEEKLGQGRESAKQYLKENPKMSLEIYKKIWEAVEKENEEALSGSSNE